MLRRVWQSPNRTVMRLFSTDTMKKLLQAHRAQEPEMSFVWRHVGTRYQTPALDEMLKTVNAKNIEDLMNTTLPDKIRNTPQEDKEYEESLGRGMTESECLAKMKDLQEKNKIAKCFIGQGYNPTVALPVIIRNVLQNPAWYTSYTPYQSEVAQGRMEGLFYFQSMIADITGLQLANASLLDEATALAEGVQVAVAIVNKRRKVLIENNKIFPQSLDVLHTRSKVIGLELIETDNALAYLNDPKNAANLQQLAAVVTQTPDNQGVHSDLTTLADTAHSHNLSVVVATDLLACSLLKPPGDMGADIVVGSAQRFGVPMGYGGPHAGFIACRQYIPSGKKEFIYKMPGRFMGLSPSDRFDEKLFRITLQTRETHVRRDKATSNICTAQALLANMAAFYGMYHGPHGLSEIAARIRLYSDIFQKMASSLGYHIPPRDAGSQTIFDTVFIDLSKSNSKIKSAEQFAKLAESKYNILLRVHSDKQISFSMHEQMTFTDLEGDLLELLHEASNSSTSLEKVRSSYFNDYKLDQVIPAGLKRESKFMTHKKFNSYHTEMELQRYLHYLNRKDVTLLNSMIPLGSCTMKLNAAAQMLPLSWRGFTQIHPFAPAQHAQGYLEMMKELKQKLTVITGFDGFSLQPNSGANGEFTGLNAIIKYHESKGEGHRKICLIPQSAHGTNPASATFCGLKVIAVECDKEGNTDIKDLQKKLEKYGDQLSCLMITYPSTHGVFQQNIIEMCEMVHAKGGQVYMDGANMNAQVGYTSPGKIGADVCHLNLHKTFCIPHGGGGPGMGPIGVKKHLEPFLPGHTRNIDLETMKLIPVGGSTHNGAVSAGPFGSPLIQCISFSYLNMMGAEGLRRATESAILNANYVASVLEPHYGIVFKGKHGRPGHECIIDCRKFKKTAKITVEDIAKRLMDYGFHAPTMSWPVGDTFMIEPTECESKAELDRFCQALIQIRKEIQDIEEGKAHPTNNPLKNAPHCEKEVTGSQWDHPYSRQQAAFPLKWIRERGKFWPSSRVQNAAGDKNLICNCGDVSDYSEV